MSHRMPWFPPTVRVIGSTMPATPTSAHTVARPSALVGSMAGVACDAIGDHAAIANCRRAPGTDDDHPANHHHAVSDSHGDDHVQLSPATLPASLPANADNNLNTIYQQYLQFVNSGGTGTFSSSLSNLIQIQGTSVGVQVHGKGTGDFNALVSSLESMGMQISATDRRHADSRGHAAHRGPASGRARTPNLERHSAVSPQAVLIARTLSRIGKLVTRQVWIGGANKGQVQTCPFSFSGSLSCRQKSAARCE